MNFDNLTSYLDGLEEQYGIPCCDCAVAKEHKIIYRHMAGYSDYEKTHRLDDHALFRLFSATKVITMVAALQLVEKGKLGLYDEVTNYLPEYGNLLVADQFLFQYPLHWPERGEKCHLVHNSIRIIDLMTMTAGLNYNTGSREFELLRRESGNQASTREVVAEMARMPLVYEPRTRWAYSFGLDVVAAVIEVVSGEKFGDYLKENIFDPLELHDFSFSVGGSAAERVPAMYMGVFGTRNIKKDDGTLSGGFRITDNYESGGAGLIGSVSEYIVILDALANGGVGANGKRILSHDAIELLMTPYTTGIMQEDFAKTGKKGYSYGLGVRVLTDPAFSKSPLGEFGWDGAAGAYALVDPIHKLSIFYAQHIVGFPIVYSEIHPALRDLVYKSITD